MSILYGVMAGDIAGSLFEFNKKYIHIPDNEKNIFSHISDPKSRFTDDTIMTVAVMNALINCNHNDSDEKYKSIFIESMQYFGKAYINRGFGHMFHKWILSDDPKPYGSYGNGAAMRVSPVGWYAQSLEETEYVAKLSCEISHNTENAIIGAQIVAGIIYLAKNGSTKEDIKQYAINKGIYIDNMTVANITDYDQTYNIICKVAVAQSIVCLLESNDINSAIENAISIGGDSDTLGAITGSMADALYGGFSSSESEIENMIIWKLGGYPSLNSIINEFREKYVGSI